MTVEIKQRLLDAGLVSEAQLRGIETEAQKRGMSLAGALVALQAVKPSDMGECLADVTGLPYVSLVGRRLPAGARTAMSGKCARHWKVFAFGYDPIKSQLKVAVSDPAQIERMRRVYNLLLESYELDFTVASEPEIEAAIEEHFGEVAAPAPVPKGAPGKPLPSQAKGTGKIPLMSLHKRMEEKNKQPAPAVPAEPATPAPSVPEPRVPAPVAVEGVDSEGALRALANAVALLVEAHLEAAPGQLARVRSRAQYCQLIAARLNLTYIQTAKVVMAAWLSGLEEKKDVVRRLVTPYELDKIIAARERGGREDVESLILTLVLCYQDLEVQAEPERHNVNTVRHALHLRWSGAAIREDILETFLQILMDEQFVHNKLDQAAGRVLILDTLETMAPVLEPALAKGGYRTQATASVSACREMVAQGGCDVLMIYAETPAREMLDFCRQVRTDSSVSALPILVIVGEQCDVRGADFLRAGASDFLPVPVDVELMYLKVERQASAGKGPSSAAGVSGNLSDMSFTDLLQVLSAGSKSTEISVTQGDQAGRLFIRDGNVIHAELGDARGEQAFFQLMSWQKGQFLMKECSAFPEPTITASTMSLLMEGARQADESQAE